MTNKHYAANLAGLDVQVCKAFDINNVCNDVNESIGIRSFFSLTFRICTDIQI